MAIQMKVRDYISEFLSEWVSEDAFIDENKNGVARGV